MAETAHDDESQEPEVIFEPSAAMVEAVNEGEGKPVARAKARASEAVEEAPAHQYDEESAEYPGQPRIPQRDEGPSPPPTLEEIAAAQEAAAASGETLRDRHAYQEAAGLYVYEGGEQTNHTLLGELVPKGEKDFRGVQDPNVLKLLAEQAEALQLRKKS